MNKKDLRASTLVGMNWENPVPDPLAVQQIYIDHLNPGFLSALDSNGRLLEGYSNSTYVNFLDIFRINLYS